MNWIILIVAGLFETGFAFCLGKMKEATGAEYCWWGTGFLLSLALSMTLLAKATQSLCLCLLSVFSHNEVPRLAFPLARNSQKAQTAD